MIVRGNALRLPLADNSIDLIVTSPPFWALRSYRDGGEHYGGQLGSEEGWPEFLDNLLAVTAECVRVLKPSGSLFVELGDKYAGSGGHNNAGISAKSTLRGNGHVGGVGKAGPQKIKATLRNAPDRYNQNRGGVRAKSLICIPERYRIRCIDELGLIARATIVWSRLNGLPESVTDRVRRSHSEIVHLTKSPTYYAAVDEIREPHLGVDNAKSARGPSGMNRGVMTGLRDEPVGNFARSPLGALPGSVWAMASEPLRIPEAVKAYYDLPDHFACLDDQTEVMTPRGWLRHDELQAGDAVAGYDLDAGTARWTRCFGVNRYDHDGPMVAVEKRDLSMRLTENHRCIVRRPHSVVPLVDAVVRADQLGPRHAIPRSAPWEESTATKAIGVDFASLCGWVAAEGWVRYPDDVRLCQSLTTNPEKVAAIDALLDRLPLVMASRSGRKRFRASILGLRRYLDERPYNGRPNVSVNWALPLGVAQEIMRLIPDKLLPWSFTGLPEDERRAVLEAFIDGDGHRRPDGRIGIFQKLRHNLDVLQAVAVTLGYKTTLREQPDKFVLYLTTGGRAITLRGTNGVNAPIGREQYKGTVWCPTTGTGTFIARRNGSVFITGNSFPTELPRRIVLGWSPPAICTACGEGRRPVVDKVLKPYAATNGTRQHIGGELGHSGGFQAPGYQPGRTEATITGYACSCWPEVPPTRPSVILDPFSGTGTVVGVAEMLGRKGIGVDLSHDYCRLAKWRTTESGHFHKAAGLTAPAPPIVGQGSLL